MPDIWVPNKADVLETLLTECLQELTASNDQEDALFSFLSRNSGTLAWLDTSHKQRFAQRVNGATGLALRWQEVGA